MTNVSSRRLKKQILPMLEKYDLSELDVRLAEFPPKETINVLFSAICREDPQIRWAAINAMGKTVARLAAESMEEARIIMRRFLWSLNDESGGIGWGAPEAMAEVMYQHSGLAREYIHMLASYTKDDGDELHQDGNFLELPALQKGVLWGVARLAEKYPELLASTLEPADMQFYLSAEDPEIRGLAALICSRLESWEQPEFLATLGNDTATFTIYEDGAMNQRRINECVKVLEKH